MQSTASTILVVLRSTSTARNDSKHRRSNEINHRSRWLLASVLNLVYLEQNMSIISKAAMRKAFDCVLRAIERCVHAFHYYCDSKDGANASPSALSYAFEWQEDNEQEILSMMVQIYQL